MALVSFCYAYSYRNDSNSKKPFLRSKWKKYSKVLFLKKPQLQENFERDFFAPIFPGFYIVWGNTTRSLRIWSFCIWFTEWSAAVAHRKEFEEFPTSEFLGSLLRVNAWLSTGRGQFGWVTMVDNSQEYRLYYWATHSSVCLFARTAHSFASSGLLALLAPSAALTRSLVPSLRSLPRSWESEFLMSQNDLVLSHSAL